MSSMVVFSLNPNTLETGGALEFKAIFVYVVNFQANQVYAVRSCIKKGRKHWVQTVELSPQVKTTATGTLSLIPETHMMQKN